MNTEAPNKLTVTDMLTLRRMNSRADAQQFMAQKGIPVDRWPQYLNLVGTLVSDTAMRVTTVDPMRHWIWSLLHLNGLPYRAIGEFYNVTHTTVYEGVCKHLTAAQRHVKVPKPSLEFMSQLVTAASIHRNEIIDTSEDCFTVAQRLHDLAAKLGD